jgi:hypothetical protein
MAGSTQVRFEGVNDGIYEVCHTLERFKNRLTSNNLRLSERYSKSELEILVACSVISGCGDIDDFVATFQKNRGLTPSNGPIGPNNNVPTIDSCGDGEKKAMLVDSIQLMDMPESIVATTVRLYRKQHFFSGNGHLVYFSLANGRCVLLRTLADGEVGIFVRSSASCLDKLPSQMVERTSKVVENIPNNWGEVVWGGVDAADVQSYVLNLRLFLNAECIRFRIAEGANSNIQITDVLFGPFNFKSDPVNSVSTHGRAIP